MVNIHESESPLDAVAGTVGERTTEAFKILGNDTRLAILVALWEAKNPGPPLSEPSEPVVSFAELRKRVGMRDGSQFNYHLTQLVGHFVRQTDDGYTLTKPGERILRVMIAGTLTDHAPLEDEPIDTECVNCGAPRVMDYRDGTLIERCINCEGAWHEPDDPPGVVAKIYRPPVGLEHRTPQEFQRHGNVWDRHRVHSTMEGVCPDCSGTVATTNHVCDDHDTHEGTVCKRCGTLFEIQTHFVCEVCKYEFTTPAYLPIFTELAVTAFFHEHGLNPDALLDEFAWKVLHDAITHVAVVAEQPLEIEVTVELDGDRLDVILDDEARVTDVTEQIREPA